jgi:hypothetical protein
MHGKRKRKRKGKEDSAAPITFVWTLRVCRLLSAPISEMPRSVASGPFRENIHVSTNLIRQGNPEGSEASWMLANNSL